MLGLESIRGIPQQFQMRQSDSANQLNTDHLAGVLDLITTLNSHNKFLPSAMTLCNEIASRYRAERVSLGWMEKGYIKLSTMSHADTFDKKMDAVKNLELAMEEACDQDSEIVYPPPIGDTSITRDHKKYCKSQDVQFASSIPLRMNNKIVGVVTIERKSSPLHELELKILRLAGDQIVHRLVELQEKDRWLGARILSYTKEAAAGLLGFEHTGAKLLGIFCAVVLAFICFYPWPFRVDAPLILRTDDVSQLSSPYDGHIENVTARVGDEVKQDQQLLALDQKELLLKESELKAEINRFQREAEKARAADQLADMRIAQSLMEQAEARLSLVKLHKELSVIKAPFSGVVVEGDQNERVGAPVKQGEILFKIAKIKNIYAEMEVSEKDIQFIKLNSEGEIALTSLPDKKHPIKVSLLEPSAIVKKGGNVFLVEAKFSGGIPEWWRPGMTGVAKIDVKKKSLLWILTRDTMDFFRLHFWW